MLMNVMQHLISKKSVNEAWDTLKILNLGHPRVREATLQTFQKKFENLEVGEDETLDAFASRVPTIVNGIHRLDEKLEEISVVRCFLCAAPAWYISVVSAIEQCIDLKTVILDNLVRRFKAHDERMKITYGDAKVEEHIMLTRAQWQAIDAREKSDGASGSGRKKEDSHSTKKSGNKGKKPTKKFDKKNLYCHKCNQLGHFKSECRNAPAEKALMAREGDDGPMMMMVEVCEQSDNGESPSQEPAKEIVKLKEEKVLLHDRTRNTAAGDKAQFSELNLLVGGMVRFSDGRTVGIKGRGTVLFELKDGGHKVLTDVYYIPRLKSNIISLGQLAERRCEIVLKDEFLWGYDHERKLIMKVERAKNRLYILNLDCVDPICLMTSMKDSAWKWHTCYVHLNFQALRELRQKQMVHGLPCIDHVEQLCDGCLIGKQR
jgi:hypothetical protein